MKSVVLVVASLLALGSALPVPEEEAVAKPQGFTPEQLQLLFSANPEDNDIDHSEPVAVPLPLNLNEKVEEKAEPVPVQDAAEEIREQEAPKAIDESKQPSEAEEPVAPEEKVSAEDNVEKPQETDESQVPSKAEESAAPEEETPAEDDTEKLQEEVVPKETFEPEQPAVVPIVPIELEAPDTQEFLPPADYVVPEEPIVIEDPVFDEEPQTPFDETFEVPERYRTPLFPVDSDYDSYSTVEQEPIIRVVPIEEAGLVGVMDEDEEDFSDEGMDFENDGPNPEPVEGMITGIITIDQDGVITGSEIIENGPAPVVEGYEDEGYSQEPMISEDDISEDGTPEEEVIEEIPQVFFVPENEGEMVEEGFPVEVMVNPEGMPFDDQIETEELDPEYHPEMEFDNPEYSVPAVGTIFVDDDQEEPEENSDGVYFVPSQVNEDFATDERVFETEENPGSVFYIPDNNPLEVSEASPMMGDSFGVPIEENENPEVLVVEGEDDEGDRFAIAVEEDENGEIQREILVAEIAEEDSSEESEDDMLMEETNEDGYDDPLDEVASEDGESLSGEPIVYDVPVKEVFVVEEEGPNEEVIALAVEDENGNIHGEIIDAEVDEEGFPSETFPGEGTLPEGIFVPVEDSNEEEPDLEVDIDEDGEVFAVVPETEAMFPEDADGPLVELNDGMDEETDEEPYPVILEENDEEEVSPIEVTPEDVDGEEPFLVMGFDDSIVPVITPIETYPEDEVRPNPPVAVYPFYPELPMNPEEEVLVIPEEVPFGMEAIPDETQPEEFEGEDDDEEEEVFELNDDMMTPGIIPDTMDEPETPEIVLSPQEVVEIVPYEYQFNENNRPIIFPEDDGPSHNFPVFPIQSASRVALPLGEKLAGDDEGYYSADEEDEVQQPWVARPLVEEAMEPQVLQVPDKNSNNLLPTANMPSPNVQQQQPQFPMVPQNPFQRYSPAFTEEPYTVNRNVPIPSRSSYAPYPFQSQYNPKYSQVSNYYDLFNRQPYIPQSYDRYNHQVYYDGHTHDDDSFYDDLMHDDVPIYYEQPTYYNTPQIQNPFYNYKGYASSSVPSYSEYRPYTYNFFRPNVY